MDYTGGSEAASCPCARQRTTRSPGIQTTSFVKDFSSLGMGCQGTVAGVEPDTPESVESARRTSEAVAFGYFYSC